MENIYNLVAKEIGLDTQKSIITNTNKTLDIKSLQYDLNYSKSNKNVSNLTTFVFFVGNY